MNKSFWIKTLVTIEVVMVVILIGHIGYRIKGLEKKPFSPSFYTGVLTSVDCDQKPCLLSFEDGRQVFVDHIQTGCIYKLGVECKLFYSSTGEGATYIYKIEY